MASSPPARWVCTCGHTWPCRHAIQDDTKFNFLALPGEIRNKIYEILFSTPLNHQDRTVTGDIILRPAMLSRAVPTVYQPPQNIFTVCRCIRQEARSLYYLSNNFEYKFSGHDHERDKTMFRRWLRSLGNDDIHHLRQVNLTDSISLNQQRTAFILPLVPEGTQHIFRAQFRLGNFPPVVTVSLAHVIPQVPVNRRCSSTTWRHPPRRLVRQAKMELHNMLNARLTGLFGCGHPGQCRRTDLEDIIDMFVDAMRCCFGMAKGRKYWLRKRPGREVDE
jgi:hypothetical protein